MTAVLAMIMKRESRLNHPDCAANGETAAHDSNQQHCSVCTLSGQVLLGLHTAAWAAVLAQ
jgi:hypothetical protein